MNRAPGRSWARRALTVACTVGTASLSEMCGPRPAVCRRRHAGPAVPAVGGVAHAAQAAKVGSFAHRFALVGAAGNRDGRRPNAAADVGPAAVRVRCRVGGRRLNAAADAAVWIPISFLRFPCFFFAVCTFEGGHAMAAGSTLMVASPLHRFPWPCLCVLGPRWPCAVCGPESDMSALQRCLPKETFGWGRAARRGPHVRNHGMMGRLTG